MRSNANDATTRVVSTPANIFIYNVDDETKPPRWVGAVSLTQNLIDGCIRDARAGRGQPGCRGVRP